MLHKIKIKRVLIFGSTGYVGTGLKTAFKQKGIKVFEWNSAEDINLITRIDIEKISPDLIVNASAIIDKSYSFSTDSLAFQVNSRGPGNIVSILSSMNSSIPFVNLSTRDVYGDSFSREMVHDNAAKKRYEPFRPFDTESPTKPVTNYGYTKLIGEWNTLSYQSGIVLRLCSPYSDIPHKRGGWIQKMCKAKAENKIFTLNGVGWGLRDPLHTDDIADLILKLISTQNMFGPQGLYVAGGPESFSIVEVAEMLGVQYSSLMTGYDFGCTFNNAEVSSLFDWTPKIKLKDSLQKLVSALSSKNEDPNS